nr:tRNA lysidine(34) synthetase TilS [Sphingomonas japonica]
MIDVAADRVLVAVSGGPDSVALLLLAHEVLGDRCHAATVDHGIRAAAAAEAAFVARLCDERGIAHRILTGPMPPRAGRTANLSARARAMRYALLERHLAECGGGWLATGHHADDQLETLVMRLNRGAGVAGLSGVRVRGGRIVRPLLGWRRAELVALVAQCGIKPVSDPSNADDRFDRARLRKELAGAGWLDAGGWAASAAALADAEEALDFATDLLMQEHCDIDDVGVGFVAEGLPFELRRRLTARCLDHVQPHIDPRGDALVRLVRTLDAGGIATLGGVRARAGKTAHGRPYWRFAAAPPRRSG